MIKLRSFDPIHQIDEVACHAILYEEFHEREE